MPTAYLANRRYEGWREEMETSLRSSREDWIRTSYPLEHSGYEPQYQSVSRRYIISNAQTRSVSDSTLHRASEDAWKELENASQDRQREFLLKYQKKGKFKVETINCENKAMRGDHLFYQGGSSGMRMYEHHFLCTDVYKDGIEVIEYTGPRSGLDASSQSVSASNPFESSKIKRKFMTFEELQENKTKKRVWPRKLERFDVNRVIERATKKREGEQLYHLFDNNCEHFVTWCKCGLNTSLQVKPVYRTAWKDVKKVPSSGLRACSNRVTSTILQAVANLSDEAFSAISSPLYSLGFVAGGLIEAHLAAYSINNDYKELKEGKILEQEFKVNTVQTIAKGLGRFSGETAGSIIGSPLGPVGSIVGGVIGACVGHLVGAAAGWLYEDSPKIQEILQDYIVAPVKKAVSACSSAVSTVVSKICEGVKSVFNFLFSW